MLSVWFVTKRMYIRLPSVVGITSKITGNWERFESAEGQPPDMKGLRFIFLLCQPGVFIPPERVSASDSIRITCGQHTYQSFERSI